MEQQLVIFELAEELYGIDIAMVESIIKMQAITAIPRAPAFVEGVTNLRGKILPVIDLRKRFGFPLEEITKDTRIVVVEMNEVAVGIVVDEVNEVLRVNPANIEPPPPIVTTVDSSFIRGIARVAERLVILLDLDKTLSTNERSELGAMPSVA
ncbi:chemotaxis protein CheW [Chloroflexi bacterium CFX6]|nr:chemotaxis protein CheW [Chloroflexi bacterium CFX6]